MSCVGRLNVWNKSNENLGINLKTKGFNCGRGNKKGKSINQIAWPLKKEILLKGIPN